MSQFQARQGDVWIESLDEVPTTIGDEVARQNSRLILAHGEMSGHSHAVAEREARLFALPVTGDRLLRVMAEGGAHLVHEEHATIALPRGDYLVRYQREYTPGEIRRVAD